MGSSEKLVYLFLIVMENTLLSDGDSFYIFKHSPRLKEKQPLATDLIGLGLSKANNDANDQESKVDLASITANQISIPTSDRPMSFVQELDESAIQTDDDDDDEEETQATTVKPSSVKPQAAATPEAITKTTIKTTTVLKIPKQHSSKSISEEEIRKELPNLPRKK